MPKVYDIDDHTRRVTEGIYTFGDHELEEEVAMRKEEERLLREMRWQRTKRCLCILFVIIGVILILTVIIVGLILTIIRVNYNISQQTTTKVSTFTTTTGSSIRGFNQSCISNANCTQGVGLSCNGGICNCSSGYHWSYNTQSCIACASSYAGFMDVCWTFWYTPSAASGSTYWTWNNSAAYCIAQGTQLMALENYNKLANVQYRMTGFSQSYNPKAWINSYTTIPKVYTWPNNDTVNPAFFFFDQPDNAGNTTTLIEGCLAISWGNYQLLSDESCSSNFNFLCEYYN